MLKIRINRVSCIELLAFLSVFFLIEPPYLSVQSGPHKIYLLGSMIAIVFVCLLVYYYKKISLIMGTIALFYVFLLTNTFFKGGDVETLLRQISLVVPLCLLFDILLKTKYKYMAIKSLKTILYTYVLINLFTVIFFPNGIFNLTGAEHSWFLGHKNSIGKYIMLLFLANDLDAYYSDKTGTFQNFILHGSAILTLVLIHSVTSLIVISAYVLAKLTIRYFRIIKKIFTVKNLIIANVLFFVLVIKLHIQDLFANVITLYLNKDLSFSGRTYLWDRAIKNIASHPVFGYGILTPEAAAARNGYTNASVHNLLLDYLLIGGVVAIIFLVAMHIMLSYRVKNYDSRLKRIIGIFFVTNSIFYMTETFLGSYLIFVFLPVIICCNLENKEYPCNT